MKLCNQPSPFGRIGGKKYFIKTLLNYFPEQINEYIEPFLGSGVVFFSMMNKYNPNKIVLNDLDDDVYIAMKGLKDDATYINDNIIRSCKDVDDYNSFVNNKDACSIIRAYKFGFFSLKKACTNKFHIPIKTNFLPFGEKLRNAELMNQDVKTIVDSNNTEDAFYYLDPPYEGSTKSYYKHSTITPQQVLDIVKTIKGKFMLSYNDSENIRNLFKNYNIYQFDKIYSGTQNISSRQITELIITNYLI
jgi:DNA adenine methylase